MKRGEIVEGNEYKRWVLKGRGAKRYDFVRKKKGECFTIT